MFCSVCKQHGKFYNYVDSDVCEDCEAKAETKYAEMADWNYWHSDATKTVETLGAERMTIVKNQFDRGPYAHFKAASDNIYSDTNFRTPLDLVADLRALATMRTDDCVLEDHSCWKAADEIERLRDVLRQIVDAHDARSELFTSDADCAANLADRARSALK